MDNTPAEVKYKHQYKFRAEKPERVKEINRKAVKKYTEKNREWKLEYLREYHKRRKELEKATPVMCV